MSSPCIVGKLCEIMSWAIRQFFNVNAENCLNTQFNLSNFILFEKNYKKNYFL